MPRQKDYHKRQYRIADIIDNTNMPRLIGKQIRLHICKALGIHFATLAGYEYATLDNSRLMPVETMYALVQFFNTHIGTDLTIADMLNNKATIDQRIDAYLLEHQPA